VQHPSQDQVRDVAEVFRLLGEPNRLRIVLGCMDEPMDVGALSARLGLSQSLTSHHLRPLRTARLLRATRHGRHVAYAIDDDHVRDVLRNMVAHFTEPHEHAHAPRMDDAGDKAGNEGENP
jgi:DNA-binding transcriptional ArsR family regulator